VPSHWAGRLHLYCPGIEFDYVGVIFGTDLVYRHGVGWVGNPSESYDTVVARTGERFIDLAKNTYRVLLTRGMKGCFVTFADKETESFSRSRVEHVGEKAAREELSTALKARPIQHRQSDFF
jgi:DUF2075 family protein